MRERQPTKQPDLRPAKEQPSSGLRGGAYGKADLHDTGNSTWLHGGRGEDHPFFDPGHKGAKKPKLRKWPY
jgi:hypothetical protein